MFMPDIGTPMANGWYWLAAVVLGLLVVALVAKPVLSAIGSLGIGAFARISSWHISRRQKRAERERTQELARKKG